jgi:uncharacterized membrane protein
MWGQRFMMLLIPWPIRKLMWKHYETIGGQWETILNMQSSNMSEDVRIQPHSKGEEEKEDEMIVHGSIQSFSGPLPPPEVLKKYNDIVPGAAQRMIAMAEGQFTHRTTLEKKVIEADLVRSRWGQILGFVIAIFGLGISGVISLYGKQWAGGVIGVTTLASLVGVFMYGSHARSKERERKDLEERE